MPDLAAQTSALREMFQALIGEEAPDTEHKRFVWQDEDEEPVTKALANDHSQMLDEIEGLIHSYIAKKRELERQLMPLNEKITEANEKIALATSKAQVALAALTEAGLCEFDTEKVAESFKRISENSIDLEKAESEKLGSI